ncbi:urease accessory protein UreF [Crystallibacter degradans]|uniref:urease accessory protein UreF n=1 Tax=Crystallibacter degradans TaxID=2726743 RepID=UPI0014759FA6|nr:urease accessory UreF family protein [Arthrobacter sp. SF27]NMR28177.1 urease accessory protein UreF [Arthrobacter sp. SF27]
MADNAAALLLLADGRLPAGGYAHSGGLEATIRAGRVHDADSLEKFLTGRAVTAGLVAGAFAAAACHSSTKGDQVLLQELDPELDARIPSPALRAVSRSLGRQLLRAATAIRPHPRFHELDRTAHQPIVFGVAAAAFDLAPRDAALAVLHEAVAGPAVAAVKLLSLDPFSAHAALARLTPLLDQLASEAAKHADTAPADLPSAGAPLLDIAAEHHAATDMRLFAS